MAKENKEIKQVVDGVKSSSAKSTDSSKEVKTAGNAVSKEIARRTESKHSSLKRELRIRQGLRVSEKKTLKEELKDRMKR